MPSASPGSSASYADASATPYWLDDPDRPDPLPPLDGAATTDLAVVGGGYLGLWTALLAKERDPGRDVMVVEGETCGHAASGRNGGFCEASLTHGFGNGLARWPGDLPALLELGHENLVAIEDAVRRHGIDCDFQLTGSLAVATREHEIAGLHEEHRQMRRSATRTAGSTATRSAPGSTHRPSWRRTTTLTRRSSSRPAWPGACARRAWRPAYGSWRGRGSPTCPSSAPASRSRPVADR